jgi:hypothetical protein
MKRDDHLFHYSREGREEVNLIIMLPPSPGSGFTGQEREGEVKSFTVIRPVLGEISPGGFLRDETSTI